MQETEAHSGAPPQGARGQGQGQVGGVLWLLGAQDRALVPQGLGQGQEQGLGVEVGLGGGKAVQQGRAGTGAAPGAVLMGAWVPGGAVVSGVVAEEPRAEGGALGPVGDRAGGDMAVRAMGGEEIGGASATVAALGALLRTAGAVATVARTGPTPASVTATITTARTTTVTTPVTTADSAPHLRRTPGGPCPLLPLEPRARKSSPGLWTPAAQGMELQWQVHPWQAMVAQVGHLGSL